MTEDPRTAFQSLVVEQLLPQFCSHYGYDIAGFKKETIERIGHYDAMWFLEALRTQAVTYNKPFFLAPQSGAKEQIFWQAGQSKLPRPITIWVEPVVTIAAAGRLHSQFNWPRYLIGLQSKKNWAFDLVGYDSCLSPMLVCEVKKSHREVDQLINAMLGYFQQLPLTDEPKKQSLRNAYRKVVALREMMPRVVWVVGPENYGEVFSCLWNSNGEAGVLVKTGEAALSWPAGPYGA